MEAATAAELFISEMEFKRTPRWLTLLGDPGVGKTMLARQILSQSAQYNPGRFSSWMCGLNTGDAERNPRPYCVFIDASNFTRRLMAGEFSLPESYFNDFCVVFDDLGSSRDKSEFIADAIYRFACSRLGKWTVWTSNFGMSDISDRIDPRVTSRLIRDENRLVTIEAEDYALTGRRK